MKTVHLIRHAQAEHNVGERYHLHDPLLTALGEKQAKSLLSRLPVQPGLVVASPLKRTLQTALLGTEHGGRIVVLPELQETSSEPCDTGSAPGTLMKMPQFEGIVDFSTLSKDWCSKKGPWAPSAPALKKRALAARQWFAEQPHDVIVGVSHGGFLHYLTEDFANDGQFPGTGWANTECRTYDLTGGDTLVETESSKQHRDRQDLSPEEERHQLDEIELTV